MGIYDPKPSLSVWIITLGVGESVTKDDFETCSRAVDKFCVPKHSYLKGETAWRYIVGCLLPQMVMRRRHIPRNKWAFYKSKQVEGTGKPYISMTSDTVDEPLAMGFSVAETGAAMAFAHSIGAKHQVTNIGVGIRTLTPAVSNTAYVNSHLHELTAREERSIAFDVTKDEKATLRRLNIILSVKDAYIKAVGQPVGFDYSRIDCDVPNKMMSVDGQTLAGWHIRLFNANIAPTEEIKSHNAPTHYQIAVAVFRGGHGMKFSFAQSPEELSSFVTFFDVKEVVHAVPRLGEYDNSALPPLDQIPLSNKNSMASIRMSEKEKEKLREKERREAPPMPPVPIDYTNELRAQYPNGYPSKETPSSKVQKSYPSDTKHGLPAPPSMSNVYNSTSQSYSTSSQQQQQQQQYSSKGLPQVPSGPAPSYTASTRASHSHSHSSGFGYPTTQQQYQQPIHTARR